MCPTCYAAAICNMNCTIEPDLQEGTNSFGSHVICDKCDESTIYTKEWWDRYKGFIKER